MPKDVEFTFKVTGLDDETVDLLNRDAQLCRELADHLSAQFREYLAELESLPAVPRGTSHDRLVELYPWSVPAFYVDPGKDHCNRCGDTNYDRNRVCLTCTYPDDPCSGVRRG